MRRVDEDRWLASRFASAGGRARLIALYAVYHEIARTAETVSEPALGDMRLTWWRDALSTPALAQSPRALALFHALWPEPEARALLIDVVEARRAADLSAAAFATLEDVETYAELTAGKLIALAALGCGASLTQPFVSALAHTWGLTGLARAAPFWAARGRAPGVEVSTLFARASDAHAAARAMPSPPASAFAAYGYVALAPLYWRAPREGPPALILRQLRITAAAATGRL